MARNRSVVLLHLIISYFDAEDDKTLINCVRGSTHDVPNIYQAPPPPLLQLQQQQQTPELRQERYW